MIKERIAALLVLLPMAAVTAAVAWFGWSSDRAPRSGDTVIFNLTGVASADSFSTHCSSRSRLAWTSG